MSLLGAPTHRAPIGLLTDGTAANVFVASWHPPKPEHWALGSEEASPKCQAHDGQGAKNNENNVLHRVIDFLNSCICHWNFPFLYVGRF